MPSAIYAGQDGPIRLSADPHNGNVQVHISDQGPGVPPESLSQLFDPFFRPDIARTRETGGTGLGLAIVKSGIEACGGRVSVRNLEPHGLELEFVLERAE
jgi:two-component system sensor histidine kinase CpxA